MIGKLQKWLGSVCRWYANLDPNKPRDRAIQKYVRQACSLGVVVMGILLISLMAGIPHFQIGDYHYQGSLDETGIATASQTTGGWYLSVTGWKYIYRGEAYTREGCAFLVWVPWSECVWRD